MATIKEIAKKTIHRKYSGWDSELEKWAIECCVEAATEQDRIARQECIKAAICLIKEVLQDYAFDWCRTVAERNNKIDELIDESFVEHIRKAMEGGE